MILSMSAVAVLMLACLGGVLRQVILLKKENKALSMHLEKEAQKEQIFLQELEELKKQINETLMCDHLTGLPSRQVLQDRLIQLVNQSKRYQLTFGVLFLNLDDFKVINNALGYDIGDELLKQVAARLLQSMRQVDTVCRFAGDTFILLASQISRPETCGYIAQRVLDAVAQPFQVNNQDLFLTASIGISIYPLDGEEGKTLLNNADNALHQAKTRGCNTYQFFREEMHVLSQRELTLRSSLRDASIYQELTIYYQPQVDIHNKEIICMEALLRWQHPSLGLVTPSEFIRLAENSGKIVEIGEWVIRMSCEQFQKWKAMGLHISKVSVNISFRQLENPHFIYNVSQILQQTNMQADALVLEITDGVFHKEDLLEKSLQMLKQLGIQIAIDDFGTGHLSLQQLKRFDIDYLKIDFSLTQDITQNPESEAIVKMIIALAQTLHLCVIAEGIETAEQKLLLEQIGCKVMQGHLFSVARKPEEFTESVEKMIRWT